jgi:hypothetical protein
MRALAAYLLVLAALAAWTGAASAQPRQLPALAPAADDGLQRALMQGRLTEAEYALERARSLFRLGAVRREFGEVERPSGRDATFILRDLALRLRELSSQERRAAERLLARPSDGLDVDGNGWTAPEADHRVACETNMCFHWVVSTPDAPALDDDDGTDDGDGIPDWLEGTSKEFGHVWTREIDTYGYRGPLPDVDSDPDADGRLDIYLDDLGVGFFGYCTSDDPDLADRTVFAVSAYCVVDNDYAAQQFGVAHTPEEFLQVTAAHEFNHASQFAYDFLEDWWFMEGTATNMEETVYPSVNDNVSFLVFSPVTRPRTPLDSWSFESPGYGSWIFWRFLEEKVYRGDSKAIRRIWNRARATAFGQGEYSIQAVARVLRSDGRSLAHEFGRFGFVNRLRAYADGSLYPRTPTHGSFRMGSTRRSTGWQARRLNHLTTQYISFRPRRSGVSRRALLRVSVRVSRHGGRASLIVYSTDGTQAVRRIRLNSLGRGSQRVAFRRGKVSRVDLVLSNGSSRMRDCFLDGFPPFYSCIGTPKDDRSIYSFRAVLRR